MTCLATITERLWQAWAYLSSGRTLVSVLGIGFAILAILLLFAGRTRWGHSKPLTKCIVLSILAHVWLLMYALGSRPVLPQGDPTGNQEGLVMAFESFEETTTESPEGVTSHELRDWERPIPLANLPLPTEISSSSEIQWDDSPDLLAEIAVTPLVPLEEPDDLRDPNQQELAMPDSGTATTENSPEPRRLIANESEDNPNASLTSIGSAPESASILPADQPSTLSAPEEYRLRNHRNRLEMVRAFGADEDTEAAVEAALLWLSKSQSPDGSWNSAKFGGGTETRALGEYRFGTGDRADTGVSGLALLAFLSAGHTHLDGDHRRSVLEGLSYLVREQMPSGDLSGQKQVGNDHAVVNARMYCHSIAMLALAEAYAMTHDSVLREALMKAAQYSINAQDVRGGGWRYRPGESGDLSLFGWKAMAIRSVQRSEIAVPPIVNQRMRNFINSCATGTHGGLARYRPGEGAPSPTMTAEALACRLLLGYPVSQAARQEATALIMSHLPGTQPDNVYFWYYATLALFQLQNEDWRAWNQALKSRLLKSQLPAYHQDPGSWEPDEVWGGYGGRVYSTAMSCLCLEVYYRYLPMYH